MTIIGHGPAETRNSADVSASLLKTHGKVESKRMTDNLLTDQELVQQIRIGDQQAACELYHRYAARVFGLVRSKSAAHLRSQVEPEDIVQSIFKSIFRGMDEGGYDAPPGGTLWQLIAVIAVHKVRKNATRRTAAKRDSRRTHSVEDLTSELAFESACSHELEVAMRESINRLPAAEQAAVLLRLQEFSVEEIANQLGKSRRTVERLLQRARLSLGELLDVEDD